MPLLFQTAETAVNPDAPGRRHGHIGSRNRSARIKCNACFRQSGPGSHSYEENRNADVSSTPQVQLSGFSDGIVFPATASENYRVIGPANPRHNAGPV